MDEKWLWMMEYCKSRGLPPAHEWAGREAERMYIKFLENKKKEKENINV